MEGEAGRSRPLEMGDALTSQGGGVADHPMRVSLTEADDRHQVRCWTSGDLPADRFGDLDIVAADEHRHEVEVCEFERRD